MFTGIITHLGTLQEHKVNFFTFQSAPDLLREVKNGSSISVNGVCLTVVRFDNATFTVELMPETIKKTMFNKLTKGDLVNLELSMKVDGRFDGHIVQGHIDGMATIINIEKDVNGRIFNFAVSKALSPYIVPKGSIAVNGISLTVIDVDAVSFSVGIIPYTWEHTMLHRAQRGDTVNIETDIVAKYIERIVRR